MSALDFRPLCSTCWETVHGEEPDMGDQCSTFEPGTCARCGTDAGIVFTLDPALDTEPAARIVPGTDAYAQLDADGVRTLTQDEAEAAGLDTRDL